jgi:hypothetical protein
MPESVFQAALQAETSKIIIVTLALALVASIPGLISAVVLLVRSRTKISEERSKAQIEAKDKRDEADLEERRRLNEALDKVIGLVHNKDLQFIEISRREAAQREAYDEFQRSFLALSESRTGQINKMIEADKQRDETNEVLRDTVTKAEAEIRTHAERSIPAIEIVKELPTTLQRIEESLKHLDEQLKAIPAALKSEIAPLMSTVNDLKTDVETLSSEAKRVTETILPMIAPSPTAPLTLTPSDVVVLDSARSTPPPGTLKAVIPPGTPGTPPFEGGTLTKDGDPVERLPQ